MVERTIHFGRHVDRERRNFPVRPPDSARGFEAGVVRIRWRPEAQADALFANLPAPFLAGTLHDDMVKTFPKMAVWLGHSGMYPYQAFRVGPCSRGVQFHPEVSLAGYREWVSSRAGADAAAQRKMRRGAADFQRLDDVVVAGISVLARRFADLVRASSVGGAPTIDVKAP